MPSPPTPPELLPRPQPLPRPPALTHPGTWPPGRRLDRRRERRISPLAMPLSNPPFAPIPASPRIELLPRRIEPDPPPPPACRQSRAQTRHAGAACCGRPCPHGEAGPWPASGPHAHVPCMIVPFATALCACVLVRMTCSKDRAGTAFRVAHASAHVSASFDADRAARVHVQ